MAKVSKNEITIEQLQLACRHFEEMIDAGVTENLAIRTLELFADLYAKLRKGGSASPHHVDQVKLWSIEALKVSHAKPQVKPKDYFRVEHGTPKRAFSRMVMRLFSEDRLDKQRLNLLVNRYWKLAVITVEEDKKLNKIARAKAYKTPEERWAAAGILFPTSA
jgi:hypothetical protein